MQQKPECYRICGCVVVLNTSVNRNSTEGGPLHTSITTTAGGHSAIAVGHAHFCPLCTEKNRERT